jgi:hypothetical protein
VERYEIAWAEALAQEHERQSALLATLDGEVGTFAAECAAALTGLDAIVDRDPVAALLDIAATDTPNEALARDIAQRLPGLAAADDLRDEQLSGFYTRLGDGDDLSQEMVHQTGQLLRADPDRADGILLRAIIDAAGSRSVIQHVVGPASVTALNACNPVAYWAPVLARLGEGDGSRGKLVEAARKDLRAILESSATAPEDPTGADSIPFADSLQDTVAHVERAARAITAGRLERAVADGRRRLDSDLDDLRAVCENAGHAPRAWRAARETERTTLVEELREKLEKVEKIRCALDLILPDLEVTARALATIERVRSVEGRLDASAASGIKAARMSLLLAVAVVFEASLPESRHAVVADRLPIRKRWLVAAAAVLAAAAISIALSVLGTSKTQAPDTTPSAAPGAAIPPPPTVSPVRATLEQQQQATFYSVTVRAADQGKPSYSWHLNPPGANPGCHAFGSVYGYPNRAVWNHGPTDGCSDAGQQHLGTVTVKVKTDYWVCTESFFGTASGVGVPPQACSRL